MNEKLNYKLISGIVTSLLYSGFVIMLYVGASFQMYIVANEKIRRVSKIRRLYEWHKDNIDEKPLEKVSKMYSVPAVFASSLDCPYSYVP